MNQGWVFAMAKSIFVRIMEKPVKTMVITGINCGWHSKVWDDNLVYSQTFNTEYNNNSSKTAPLEIKQQDLKVQQKYKTSLKSTRKVSNC